MPYTRRQVRFLESSGSPLSAAQKSKMNSELHENPALGHNQKGSAMMKKPMMSGMKKPMMDKSMMHEPMREMRIEMHRGPKNKLTGFTVHHRMMPKATKSAAFMENPEHSHPFAMDDHEAMMDHIHDHMMGQMDAGAVTPNKQPGGANMQEEGMEEGE